MSRPLEMPLHAAAKPQAPAVKAVEVAGSAPRMPARPKPPMAERLPARELFWMRAKKHGLAALMTCASIGALLGFWYLATLYKLDFFIRFTNIPAPGEVFANMVELMRDPRFQTNI
ncbi:MAG TPA: ABC transporter permease, partial [Limnobacter sp.]|nr:ABC transporter permease [Limnobacter sp.]